MDSAVGGSVAEISIIGDNGDRHIFQATILTPDITAASSSSTQPTVTEGACTNTTEVDDLTEVSSPPAIADVRSVKMEEDIDDTQQKDTLQLDARGMPIDTLWPRVDESGTFFCPRCSYTTDKKQNWYKHRQTHLGKTCRHQCEECDYQTRSASNMKRHKLKHQDVRNYICGQCRLQFRQKTHLERHIQKAHVDRKFPCMACKYAGTNPSELARHINSKHKDLLLIKSNQTGSPLVTKKKYMCPQCSFIDSDRRVVQQHIKFHKSKSELKMYCTSCSFVTDCLSRLRRHEMTHTCEKPFQCKLCNYRANQREHVLRHLRTKHKVFIPTNVRTHPKTSSEELIDMNKAAKTPSKPLIVAVGDSEIASIDSVKDSPAPELEEQEQQKDMEGTMNKLVKQTEFAGSVVTIDSIKGQEKLFACNFCTLTFSKLLSLYKHVHHQHSEVTSDINRLSCVICDFSTTAHKALLAHMRRHTSSEESKMAEAMATKPLSSGKHASNVPLLRKSNAQSLQGVSELTKKTVMVKVNQTAGDVPVIVDIPKTMIESVNNDDATEYSIRELTQAQELDFIRVVGQSDSVEDSTTEDEAPMMFTCDLSEVQITDVENVDEDADLVGFERVDVGSKAAEEEEEEVEEEDNDNVTAQLLEVGRGLIASEMDDLAQGDLIEINGETYKVEIGPANEWAS